MLNCTHQFFLAFLVGAVFVDLRADAGFGFLYGTITQLGTGHRQVAAAAQRLELDTVYFLKGQED